LFAVYTSAEQIDTVDPEAQNEVGFSIKVEADVNDIIEHSHRTDKLVKLVAEPETTCGNIAEHPKDKKSKLYLCTVCDKQFSSSCYLIVHRRLHTGEKPYQCPMCDKRFARKSHVTLHQRTHSGEKPYPCTVCDKRFARRENLRDHLRAHSGERPFLCTICDKRFTSKKCLEDHKRTHTGERPFMCTICCKWHKTSAAFRRKTIHVYNLL